MKRHLASLVLALACLSAHAENHALLVAVTGYPDKQQALEGPRNDAELIREVLRQRGFPSTNIQMLADGVPGAGEPKRAAILSALDGLAQKAKPGDFVYLHFAGHGSQQPALARPGNSEPDGLDEIFLPIDIGQWDGGSGTVKNAITDDVLGERITAMRNRGAFVWAVFDTCHSGTMTRGAPTGERSRQVLPSSLGIPAQTLTSKGSQASPIDPIATGLKPDAGGLVAFYAAQSHETAPEMYLPKGAPEARAHGLFSYTLAEALAQAPAINYRQLGQFVLARYAALGRYAPTPLIEGTAVGTPLPGAATASGQPQWPITQKKGLLYLNAGILHQVTPGSLLAVVPTPIAKDSEAIGYLRISQADATTSQAVPHQEPGQTAIKPEDIQPGMYARLIQPAVDLTLRVALPEPGESEPHARVREAIARMQAQPEGVRVEWVAAGQTADLRLAVKDNQLWLLPPDGQMVEQGSGKSLSIHLDKSVAQLKTLLTDSVQRVAKALNLKRLAAQPVKGLANDKMTLKVNVQRRNSAELQPLARDSLPSLRAGDRLVLELENRGQRALDVTVLSIDSQFGIDAAYPGDGETNRIEAGGRMPALEIDIHDDTTGIESLVVLAVEAEPQKPVADFRFLVQLRLENTRGTSMTGMEGLLMEAGFGEKTRGTSVARSPLGSSRIEVFMWRTE